MHCQVTVQVCPKVVGETLKHCCLVTIQVRPKVVGEMLKSKNYLITTHALLPRMKVSCCLDWKLPCLVPRQKVTMSCCLDWRLPYISRCLDWRLPYMSRCLDWRLPYMSCCLDWRLPYMSCCLEWIMIIITLIQRYTPYKFTSSRRCTLSTSKSAWQSKKYKCYKCIHQYQKSQDERKKEKKWRKKWRRSTSTVNACINIKAFHIHSNNHKYYKIMHLLISAWQSEKHKYCHDNQKST